MCHGSGNFSSLEVLAGSDAGGGQALEVAHPSAKETATRLMDAALDSVSTELSKLRTGRASPGEYWSCNSVGLVAFFQGFLLDVTLD